MPRPDAFLCSIGYAEDWLRRARQDWRNGRAPAAVRRLMLAEAEIRHARETGEGTLAGRTDPARPSHAGRPRAGIGWRLAAGLAAVAVIAAGIGYLSTWVGTTQPGAMAVRGQESRLRGGIGRIIVQLDTGRFLMPDERASRMPSPWPVGPTLQRSQDTNEPLLPIGVPVDLKTSTPTF